MQFLFRIHLAKALILHEYETHLEIVKFKIDSRFEWKNLSKNYTHFMNYLTITLEDSKITVLDCTLNVRALAVLYVNNVKVCKYVPTFKPSSFYQGHILLILNVKWNWCRKLPCYLLLNDKIMVWVTQLKRAWECTMLHKTYLLPYIKQSAQETTVKAFKTIAAIQLCFSTI